MCSLPSMSAGSDSAWEPLHVTHAVQTETTMPAIFHYSDLPKVDENRRLDLKIVIESMPAARHLGITVVGFLESGISRVDLETTPHHTFDGKVLQAGVVGALADYAGVSAAAATLGSGWGASTTGFEVHNLAPAFGKRLIAIGYAQLVKASHAVSRVEVYAQRPDQVELSLVACAMTTCRPMQFAGK